MEKETKPERADFVWLYFNDFGEEFFHSVAAALWAARARRTATATIFVSSTRQALPLRARV